MKQALVKNQLTPAAPGAPPAATCPDCGRSVKLRHRLGTYFWRHAELPRAGCPPSNPELVTSGDDDRDRRIRQVGGLVIDLHPGAPEGPHLKLRSRSAEEAGDRPQLTINLEEVRPLAAALLEAAEELAAAGTASPE